MNVHELTLQNYTAASGCPSACQPILYLGTAGSYGNEQINVVLGEGWQGLTVKAVFQPSDVPVVVPDGGGVISVPWEATQSVIAYPKGRISFQGYSSGRLVNTSDVFYTVGGSSAGTHNTPAPTPDEFQQFVDAVKSDADRAKQAAADAEKSAADAEQSAKDAADALTNVQAAGKSALVNIATKRQNTLSDIQNEGAKQQSAVAGAGTAALKAIGQTEQAAINQIKQTGETQVGAVQSAGTTKISQVNSAGAAQVQAVKDEGATQTAALNNAAEAHKNELESIASHPPQPNTATGKWQVWNAETGAYQDTDALYQGGYYTASVSDDGTLTWQGSQEGMPKLPSVNIKGPKGDKGDPGLGVPTPTTADAGKVPVVNAGGTGYELGDPQVDAYSKSESDARYAPLSAAIRPTASGNPVSITDSVEWPLLGLKVYGKSTQDGTPSPESPVPIVSAGDDGSIALTVSNGASLLQSMTIPTPNGLPGIPVDSGGNYTDTSGQQWNNSVIDYNNQKRINFVRVLKITQAINPKTTSKNHNISFAFDIQDYPAATTSTKNDNLIYCNIACWDNSAGVKYDVPLTVAARCYAWGNAVYIQFPPDSPINTQQALQDFIDENGPIVCVYSLAAPTEEPLSEEEITAYKALHTYDGATVVSTAEDVAGLEVRYVADTQKYIDDRLAAAESHIQEIAAAQLNAQTGG